MGRVPPSWFDAAIGAAITVQIATTALGLADTGNWARWWLLPAGALVLCWSRASKWPVSGG